MKKYNTTGTPFIDQLLADVEADKVDINKATDNSGHSPLYSIILYANQNFRIGYINKLIEKGVDMNVVDNGYTPLTAACYYGRTDIAKILIEKGADVNAVAGGYSPLTAACYYGRTDIAKVLIDNGADIHAVTGGYTPLTAACYSGLTDIAKVLIEKGADIHAVAGGYSSLTAACYYGHTKTTKMLIEKNADVNAVTKDYSPLTAACYMGHTDIAKMLIDNGADIHSVARVWSPLTAACSFGKHTEIVEILVEDGADVDKLANGKSALQMMTEKYNPVVIQFMQEAKSLKKAISKQQYKLTKILANKNVEIDKVTADELKWVITDKAYDLAKILVSKGVPTDKITNVALKKICANKEYELAQMLIEKGVSVDMINPELLKQVTSYKNQAEAIELNMGNEEVENLDPINHSFMSISTVKPKKHEKLDENKELKKLVETLILENQKMRETISSIKPSEKNISQSVQQPLVEQPNQMIEESKVVDEKSKKYIEDISVSAAVSKPILKVVSGANGSISEVIENSILLVDNTEQKSKEALHHEPQDSFINVTESFLAGELPSHNQYDAG